MKFIKKHIKLFIFIIVVISIYFIYKLNSNNNLTYLALGDGYALGENSYKSIDYGYSDYLKDYLKDNRVDTSNFVSKAGYTISSKTSKFIGKELGDIFNAISKLFK